MTPIAAQNEAPPWWRSKSALRVAGGAVAIGVGVACRYLDAGGAWKAACVVLGPLADLALKALGG